MSAQTPAKTAVDGQVAPNKPLTPAQTAKPMNSTPKKAGTPAKKQAETTAPTPDNAAANAQEATMKALEKLEVKTKAININNVSRVANSHVNSDEDKLQPLRSLKTGQPLDKFPATSKEIKKLGLTTVDAMLNALEADRTGTEEAKRDRLRLQIGLKPNPA
ncbi:hypothetical protein BAUCODRAFT_36634 [Baudoinia panamericana UAMH 10762]|uniref:Uncharacterized protein n=1 Tax=Baudoinia panamericana (strain UAMH 10762) TaxID=717646 RepID=M2N5V9_BAUPA|nr:uncharacterized protein BAUCODRAFT_36634 [Baudoinia panamericana UAMH 10762]EMC94160.1 hypothetical protein BAUCODRAFT_36634 [Baudoinia panamericana UAMH 10762]